MAKELTFCAETLGWRFSHTEIFLNYFIKQWELLQDVALKNLDEYWNINSATGQWLQQIGDIFHAYKTQSMGNQFVLNIDKLNDPDVVLNGSVSEMKDDLYRQLILIKSISAMRLFSMKNIAQNLYLAFGEDNIKVEFKENVDRLGNYKENYFQLWLTFKDGEMLKLVSGLQSVQPYLFIGKPMGVSYEIFFELDPNM